MTDLGSARLNQQLTAYPSALAMSLFLSFYPDPFMSEPTHFHFPVSPIYSPRLCLSAFLSFFLLSFFFFVHAPSSPPISPANFDLYPSSSIEASTGTALDKKEKKDKIRRERKHHGLHAAFIHSSIARFVSLASTRTNAETALLQTSTFRDKLTRRGQNVRTPSPLKSFYVMKVTADARWPSPKTRTHAASRAKPTPPLK